MLVTSTFTLSHVIFKASFSEVEYYEFESSNIWQRVKHEVSLPAFSAVPTTFSNVFHFRLF